MKNNTRLTMRYYWRHMKRYPLSGLVMFFATIGASAVSIVVPLYLKRFFDLLSQTGDRGVLIPALVGTLIIVAGWELVGWFLWRFSTYSASYFQAKVLADLAGTCFAYIHRHSFAFFNNSFVGSLVKKVNRFVRSFEAIADRIVFNVLQLVVQVILILIVVTRRNLYLGLGLLAWVAVFLVFNWLFVKYKLPFDIKRSHADSRSSAILADTFTNQVNVKLFNGYAGEIANFLKATKELCNLRRLTWNLGNTFEAVQGFLTIILEIGLFYFPIRLWQEGLFTVGDFVLIQSYVITLIMRVWDFGRVAQHVYEDLADAEEMTEILEKEHEIQDAMGAKNLVVKKRAVDFADVTFNYQETRNILSHFNLRVVGNEKVALVGPSGAGKSTIVRLLLRLYDVSGGKILIDGQNIAKVKLRSLWENTSLVPQDPILFHRSLKENIRYGRPEAGDKEVIRAAKLAHCHEFISEFPNGYETYVGERGVKLSGGERQRVAIARAILRDAPILILDEATSSLDSESERLIQDALNVLMKNKTVIVIAHRLSTIMKMDRIVVIDKGGIVEEGTHQDLTKKKDGIYQKLWKIQAGGFIE